MIKKHFKEDQVIEQQRNNNLSFNIMTQFSKSQPIDPYTIPGVATMSKIYTQNEAASMVELLGRDLDQHLQDFDAIQDINWDDEYKMLKVKRV